MTDTITLDSVISLIKNQNECVREEYESSTTRLLQSYTGFEDEILRILNNSFSSGNYDILARLQLYYMEFLRPKRKHAHKGVDYAGPTREFLSKL